MPPDDLQNSDSQSPTIKTTEVQQATVVESPEPKGPLNDAELKSGMLKAINDELDTPKPTAKTKEKVEKPTDEITENVIEAKPKAEKKPSEKKQTDEELYSMPEGLQKESQKRFQKLVDIAKEATTKVEEIQKSAQVYEETINNFRSILEETKTSSEDLNALLEYNRMLKTGDLDGALKLLDEQRAQISQYLGRPIDGVDYLQGHDDLKMAVQEGKITPAHAAELAKARNIGAVFRQENERTQKESRIQQENKQQVDNAIQKISEFAAKKAETDIDYKKKEEILMNSIDRISQNFPPSLWLQQIEILYDTINSVQPKPPIQNPVPLRPNSGGGGKPQPNSMADAINQGLGYSANS